MVQASPQVTAAQVLDAGRRAEADGRVEYAVQFYRHLTDHHAGAPEAAAAREALSRLKLQTSNLEGTLRTRSASPPPVRTTAKRGLTEIPRAGQRVGRGPIRIAPAGTSQSQEALELPETAGEYLAGRLIAHGFAGLGILFFVAGLLATIAGVVLPAEVAARLPEGLTLVHPLAWLAGAAMGLVLFFSGQLARAVFDIASASRNIAAIERAKVEHANAPLR